MKRLSHVGAKGRARMVDVTAKPLSHRVAKAEGFIRLAAGTVRLVRTNRMAKGSVLATAELAGIQAAKRTAELIPLCHPLPLSGIRVQAMLESRGVRVEAEIRCTDRTGVEMEALTAVSVALLTVYDMCKAVDKAMVLGGIRLTKKEKEPA